MSETAEGKESREQKIERLREIAREIRLRDVRMICEAGGGHIGGDMSCIDILTVLYFHSLRFFPSRPDAAERDRFVMSKGHCSGALYVTLAKAGFFDPAALSTYMEARSSLNGHPNRTKTPGVETNTGPLGHGLPVAVGAAIAAKIDRARWRTFALVGDGELQEGSNWEAAMAAAHFRLDNLTVIVDRNRLQQGAATATTNNPEPLAEKWRAFGWETREADGHDIAALMDVFDCLPLARGRPSCVIARTIKGRGISFMEDKAEWHHKTPNDAERAQAERELREGR